MRILISAGGGGEGEAAPSQPKAEQEEDHTRKTPKKAKQAVKSVLRKAFMILNFSCRIPQSLIILSDTLKLCSL